MTLWYLFCFNISGPGFGAFIPAPQVFVTCHHLNASLLVFLNFKAFLCALVLLVHFLLAFLGALVLPLLSADTGAKGF